MASRFASSTLHQRDPRSALFENYTGDRDDRSRGSSHSPLPARHQPGAAGYGYSGPSSSSSLMGVGPGAGASGSAGVNGGFRPATPNSRGQYSDAVLSELENQNEAQIEGMSAKVKMLKDITLAISSEIQSSSSLADSMNDGFENTRVRLRGTMNRMLRMAERTGVGWRVWLVFFTAVGVLFWWVWLF